MLMMLKTQQHTAEPQQRRAPSIQEWNSADKGRKHEAFESGSFVNSDRRTLARVITLDRKR